jgi:exodeoxyribonuclease VII small subunit
MASKEPNFADKLAELEAITEWFESDNVDLNESLTKFERGMELSGELKKELQQVENRVEKIKQKFDAPAAEAAVTAEPDTAADETSPLGDEAPSLFS